LKPPEKANTTYRISDTFMLRAPSLPLNVLSDIAMSDDFGKVLEDLFSKPLVSEAIFLASPGFKRYADSWISAEKTEDKNLKKIRYTLMKYMLRMASRATPFGLFAGISSASFGEVTKVEIFNNKRHVLHLRPDMQYLCTLSEALMREKYIREALKFYPNSSLTKVGEEYRFVEYFTDEEGIRKYQLQRTDHKAELEKILETAISGTGLTGLANSLIKHGISSQDAKKYINILIDNQVLVSSLEPIVSGTPYLEDLLSNIKPLLRKNKLIQHIEELDNSIQELNTGDQENRKSAFLSIIDLAEGSGLNFKEGSLLQGDLKMQYEKANLSNEVRKDLQEALEVLVKIAGVGRQPILEKFKEAFIRRYDGREISLAIALDAEIGPGYATDGIENCSSSLLDDIILPRKISEVQEIRWSPLDRLMHRKLQKAIINHDDTVELTDEDILLLPDVEKQLPLSFSVLAKLHIDRRDGDNKTLIHIESAGGSSAVNLAGRFCYMDESLHSAMSDITLMEQEIMGEVILAEIVHLPQQRTGNVLMRPILRGFEIPYLARSGVPSDMAIPVSDLMLSVKDGKLVLRSKSLNKYILPRLSNAHNFSVGSLPIYRFLCDLQTQDICSNLSFSWSPVESESVYLPRVVFKNIILHAARWNLHEKEIDIISKADSKDEILNVITELRDKYNIPDEVVLSSGDNELWINLKSQACLSLFQNEIKGHKKIILHEFLFNEGNSLIKGVEGSFANECLFFFHSQVNSQA